MQVWLQTVRTSFESNNVNTLQPGRAPPTGSTNRHRRVDQALQAQPHHQRADYDQPASAHQRRVVEGHLNTINTVRYSTHRKCLPSGERRRRKTPQSSLHERRFPRLVLSQPLNSSVGWPAGISPAGSHRSRRDSLPSPGSCHLVHQTRATEGTHIQCANRRGCRSVIPRQHSMAFFSARSRLYFLRIQRTR